MKFVVWCLIATLLVTPKKSQADDMVLRIGGEAYSTYIKEQMKGQIAAYLNDNPGVVFSSNHQIGTQGLRILSKSLAAYSFAVAKSDRERGWALVNFLFTPEPTTAAILFAVQLADTLINLKHQKDMARRRQVIAGIRAETSKLLATLAQQEALEKQRFLNDFVEAINAVSDLATRIKEHPVVQFASVEGQPRRAPSAEQIEEILNLLAETSAAFLRLDGRWMLVSVGLKPTDLPDPDAIEKFKASVDSFKYFRESLEELNRRASYFFGSLNAEKVRQQVRRDLQPYATTMRIYLRCVSVINTIQTERFWLGPEVEVQGEAFMKQCQEKFAL